MSQLFKHYLITRYNVMLDGFEKDKSGLSTGDADWLSHRIKLFRQYCVPTISAQRENNFTWLIYCDVHTPKDQLQEIYNSVDSIPQATIRFVTGYYDCMEDIDRTLTGSGTPFVITSRLDNDDGIGKDFIKTIHDHFIPRDGTVLNLLHGHGYNPMSKIATSMYNMRLNHFTSLIESTRPAGGHTSIRGFQHDSPPPGYTIIDLPVKNSWLKIFHNRNIKSSMFGYPEFKIDLNRLYGIDQAHAKISYYQTFLYSIWWLKDGFKRKFISTSQRDKKVSVSHRDIPPK